MAFSSFCTDHPFEVSSEKPTTRSCESKKTPSITNLNSIPFTFQATCKSLCQISLFCYSLSTQIQGHHSAVRAGQRTCPTTRRVEKLRDFYAQLSIRGWFSLLALQSPQEGAILLCGTIFITRPPLTEALRVMVILILSTLTEWSMIWKLGVSSKWDTIKSKETTV